MCLELLKRVRIVPGVFGVLRVAGVLGVHVLSVQFESGPSMYDIVVLDQAECSSSHSSRSVFVDLLQDAMDLFDDALGETCIADVSVAAHAMLAPSQDIAPAAAHAATPSDCIVISDDIDDHCTEGLSQAPVAPSQAPVQQTCDTPPCTKRVSSHVDHLGEEKRAQSRRNPFQLKALHEVEGGLVACAMIPSGKTFVPVPLWSQYIVDSSDPEMRRSKWIVVSNYERWLMQLVNLITNKSVRQVAKAFTDRFRHEFIACMTVARAGTDRLEDPFGEADSLHDNVPAAKRQKSTAPVLYVAVGGYTLTTLNNTVKIVLLLEKETVTFITNWVVPLLRELALSQEKYSSNSAEETDSSESMRTLASFHFIASPTPNIRDKVNWNPGTHSWAINLKKPIAKLPENFDVDPTVSRDLYEEQKNDAYRRAIAIWNKLDGSKRTRIPVLHQPGRTSSD